MATASRCARHGRYCGPDGCDVCAEVDRLTRLAQERHQRVLGLVNEVRELKEQLEALRRHFVILRCELALARRGFWAKLKAFVVGE